MNNIFSNLPDNLDKELIEQLAGSDTVKIERIISKGHASPEIGWYDQENNEWIIVLKGEAKLAFENELEVHLKEGGYINIPAHRRHRVSWTPLNQKTIWLAIHY